MEDFACLPRLSSAWLLVKRHKLLAKNFEIVKNSKKIVSSLSDHCI